MILGPGRTSVFLAILSVLVSCTTGIGTVSEDLETGTPLGAGPEGETADYGGSPRRATEDPLDELRQLWESGRLEEARSRFHRPDIRPLAFGSRRDEWSIWRGRLFISHFSGAQMGLAGENISGVFVDRDDLWVGTWTGGVARLSVPLKSSETFDPGLPSTAVRTVNRIRKVSEGIAVVRYGTVELYDFRDGTWETVMGLPVSERLQDLLSLGNRTYLGTLGRGLWISQGGGDWERVPAPGLFITRLEHGPGDTIFVATMDRGLYLYDVNTGSWQRPPGEWLRSVNVTSVLEYKGRFIGGTYGDGAFLWDPQTGEITMIGVDLLGDPFVLSVLEYRGRIYFGTFGGGVRTWVPEIDEWDAISLAEGFISADVASLAAGPESVWVGTLEGGVMRIHRGIYGD